MISLLCKMLSRFVIAFLPRSKCLLISWLQSPFAVILEPKKIKSLTVSTFSPYVCHEATGLDAMILVWLMLSLKQGYSPSSFTLIKTLFSSSSISAFRVVSSAYLRFLIFFLFPVCDSCSLVFCMMYSACKLNKQSDNIQYRLGLLWYGMVCLGKELRLFSCFWGCTQVLNFRLFCWLWRLLHFF